MTTKPQYTSFKPDLEFSFTGVIHERASHIAWAALSPVVERLRAILPECDAFAIEREIGQGIVMACEQAFFLGIEFGQNPLPFLFDGPNAAQNDDTGDSSGIGSFSMGSVLESPVIDVERAQS